MLKDSNLVAHYSKIENIEKILKDKKVRFGPVANLNDPRESSLSWIDTGGIGHEFNYSAWREAEDLKSSVLNKLRLFCGSGYSSDHNFDLNAVENQIYGKPRMWAQYAGDHTGFCILLDKENFQSCVQKHVSEAKHLIHGKVQYTDSLSQLSGGILIEYGSNNQLENYLFEIINENFMLNSVYFKKDIDWENESEIRWLLYSNSENDTLVEIDNSIKAVVLGYKFDNEKIEVVKEYCRILACECYKISYEYQNYDLVKLYTPTKT
ncbi:DUF2971 domain-containing protein [Neptunomonas phycophila]|uniref:DUF2971 domain-containing protein n=1 Tax=Neptunomonas phycophila TaxID=1572645 RepID=UPI003736F9A4